jgi:hypothetical protein
MKRQGHKCGRDRVRRLMRVMTECLKMFNATCRNKGDWKTPNPLGFSEFWKPISKLGSQRRSADHILKIRD